MLYYYNALLFKDFKQDRDLINSTEMRGLYADIDQEKLARAYSLATIFLSQY